MSNTIEIVPTNLEHQNKREDRKEVRLEKSDFIDSNKSEGSSEIEEIRQEIMDKEFKEINREEMRDKLEKFLFKQKTETHKEIFTIEEISKRLFGLPQRDLPVWLYDRINHSLNSSDKIKKHRRYSKNRNGFEFV